MLVRRGANLAAEDACGLTAFQLAVFNYYEDVEWVLLANKVPIVSEFYGLRTMFRDNTAWSDLTWHVR